MSMARPLRLPVLALVGTFVVTACLGTDPPEPTAAPTEAATSTISPEVTGTTAPSTSPDTTYSPVASADPDATTLVPSALPTVRPLVRSAGTLVAMAPEHPTRLLPGDHLNATERLLIDVLYDPLYRLDEEMRPVPEVARALPEVSEDGLTWTIGVKSDAKFHSGAKLRADDVTFSLRMAASPSCPLGRELCATVGTYMANAVREDDTVTITLREPYAPFLTDALGRLPILSEDDVKAATDDLIEAADRLNEDRPDRVISDIRDATSREECFEVDAPDGCRLADHRDSIEQIFKRARIDLPSQLPYVDAAGIFYEDGYLGDLLNRLLALAQVFNSTAADKQSAALGLLDASVEPFGGGPYMLERVDEQGTFYLESNRNHTRTAPEIRKMEIHVQRDPAVATTRLLSGEADWVLDVGPNESAAIDDVAGFSSATRPLDTQFGVLFNVRPGRVYFDVETRRAFAMCLDHVALATRLNPDRVVATTPFTASSWAMPEASPVERDVEAANAKLEAAGWQMATDGIRIKDEQRLSTSIAVRPTSVDLFAFANEAADQLAECGIELLVDELDLTGTTMLDQLQHPNDFDTLLWLRTLGPDPDSAVRVFESERVTNEDNIADENPAGFTSELADFYVASGREAYDEAKRAEAYAGIQEQLADQIPYWPLWYDSAYGGVASRLVDERGPIDPSQSRYDWDISAWMFKEE